eukprot:TRINITY_DN14505_c0_g1_i1.p1 TRINITY_DN14505_c0_g1~~TRINITY_DN14505_c0_g1_i1.p1  ORF type:complete len:1444 (-),score=545.59 TRINITY_DN14505_c0_g1_i1:103-4434(-)
MTSKEKSSKKSSSSSKSSKDSRDSKKDGHKSRGSHRESRDRDSVKSDRRHKESSSRESRKESSSRQSQKSKEYVSSHTKEENPIDPRLLEANAKMDKVLEATETGKEDIQILDKDGKSCTLHIAAAKNNVEDVKDAISAGLSVNKVDSDGATPLHHAAYRGSVEAALLLIENKADVNAEDAQKVTPLHHACFNGKAELVKILLQNGAKVNHQDEEGGIPLQNASFNGHPECVKLLLDAKANIDHTDADGSTCLHYASFGGNLEVVKLLLKTKIKLDARDQDGATALQHASYNGNLDLVKLLIDKGASAKQKDYGGNSPLHTAAYNNKLDVVKFFLALPDVDVDSKDREGATPLHKAAFMGDEEILKLLIDKGAKVDERDREGATPLLKAAFNGRVVCLKHLLEKGADVNAADEENGTALHNAVYNGHLECAQLLIKYKAKIDAKDGVGRTALHSASCFGLRECAQLLLENGADPQMLDTERVTPLHLAAFNGSIITAAFLLDKGANVRAKTIQGIQPLHYAAGKGRLGSIVLLIERTAPVDPQDEKGVTPLHNAVIFGNADTAAYLIYKGANVNKQNDLGESPLHYAVKFSQVEICALLVSKNADWKGVKTTEGLSAIDLARKNPEAKDINQFFDILESDKDPFSPVNKAKWMGLKRNIKKADLEELTSQLKLFGLSVGSKRDEEAARKAGGKGLYGQPVDMNNENEILEQIKFESKKLSRDKTLVNILRHLLLIPTHFDVGSKIWDLLEFFTHRVVLLRDENDTSKDVTKISLEAFKKALDKKDKIDADEKLAILKGIEDALRVLFPNCEIDGNGAVSWEDPSDEEDELDDDEDDAKKVKKKNGPKMITKDTGEVEVEADLDLKVARKKNEPKTLEELEAGGGDYELPAIPDIIDGDETEGGGGGPGGEEWNGEGPPPPPGGMGVPPPPGGFPGAPPPPGMGAPPLPGKFVFDGIKLKRFNWNKVPPPKIKGSMWIQANKNGEGIVLDKKTLEALFYVKEGKKLEAKEAEEKTSILDLQRANNIGILLAKFTQYSHADIRSAILNCDERILSLDNCRSLVKVVPNKDELEAFAAFKGDKSKLGAAEKFVMVIMDIPRLKERLESFIYKKEFPSRKDELNADIKDVNIAIHEVRSGAKLKRIMEVVLVLGNFMNRAYGFGGQAQGYTTDSLIKLADTKATEKVKGRTKYTLLHHLINYLEKVKPDLLTWREEMPHLRAGHLDRLNDVAAQVAALKEGITVVNTEVKEFKPDGGDPFGKVMAEFQIVAQEGLKELEEEIENMKKRFDNLCTYLGEEKDKADVVTNLFRFANVWDEHINDNKNAKLAQEAAAKKAVARAQMGKRVGVRQRKKGAKSTNLKGKKRQVGGEEGEEGAGEGGAEKDDEADAKKKMQAKKAKAMKKRMEILAQRKAKRTTNAGKKDDEKEDGDGEAGEDKKEEAEEADD